jgi:uncharacterized membrane protein HdeD (DUF308 family)
VTILALVIVFAVYAFIAAALQAMRAFSSATAGPVFGHVLLALIDLAVGAVTLALLFGLFSMVYGVSEIVVGVQMRRTGQTLQAVLHDAAA